MLRRRASTQEGVSGEIGNRAGQAKSRQRPSDRTQVPPAPGGHTERVRFNHSTLTHAVARPGHTQGFSAWAR